MADAVVAAALVPGMPQLLAGKPAASWADLRAGCERVGELFREAQVETVVLLSTQWFTVLGHQFQLDPNPRGQRTDENWYAYDYGRISYDLRIDTALTQRWMDRARAEGLQTRATRYDHFPIDTGTVVASGLVDPQRRFTWALVSCNLYADPEDLTTLAATAVQAADDVHRRVGVLVCSGLSAGLIQHWIEPGEEAIADPAHEVWNRRMLTALQQGDADGALAMRADFARQAAADSQFRVLAFLQGAQLLDTPAELLSYGSIWGTGAAVLRWPATRT